MALISQADRLYWDFDEALDERVIRFEQPAIGHWKEKQIAFFYAVCEGSVVEGGLNINDLLRLHSLISGNYVYLREDGRYGLSWRGEAAAAKLLKEGRMKLSENQRQVLQMLEEGPARFKPAHGRSLKILGDAGFIKKQMDGWYITDAGRDALLGKVAPTATPNPTNGIHKTPDSFSSLDMTEEAIEMLHELAQLGSDDWYNCAEYGESLPHVLARHGYIKKNGKDVQITQKGREALRAVKEAHQRAEQRQSEPAPQNEQDAAEIEFKGDQVIDKAVDRKRSAPKITGIRPLPEAAPAAPTAEPADCAPGCRDCIPKKALNLIFKKHPEYKSLLDALRTLQEFEE